jgi:AcrR family transcriptional regulator
VPRSYDSRRRQAQAAATRQAILEAADGLFARDGYVATTMEAIATEAGVALKTVYVGFGTKAGLLRSLWDLRLKGDSDDAPVAEREWYRATLAEPDPEELLRRIARNSSTVKARIGGLLGVIRTAAAVDADASALWELIQSDFHANQRVLVDALATAGGLRADLTVEQATDVLWTINHPDIWLLLVGERGWTNEQFESWFVGALPDLLLSRRAADARPSPAPRRRRGTAGTG